MVDALQLEEYRRLAHGHLATLPVLFRKVTGLESCVVWAPTWPHRWNERDLPTGSRVCRRITAASPAALAHCQNCGMRHLASTLQAGQAGHHFLCHEGVRNFWFPIIVRRCAVGIAFVQALDGNGGRGPARREATRVSSLAVARAERGPRGHRIATRLMTPSEFEQVAQLFQLIVRHAQTSVLADLREQELSRARQALGELRAVAARLRAELNHVMPAARTTPPVEQPEAHAQQMVHAVLDSISHHYRQPITLQQCAAQLGLNASYLSHLFSSAVGMPFRTYLTELRLEKARELLGDPARSISEVAFAVGYGSENRFRLAFKKATCLAPRLWRETLRMSPLTVLTWFLGERECLESLGGLFLG